MVFDLVYYTDCLSMTILPSDNSAWWKRKRGHWWGEGEILGDTAPAIRPDVAIKERSLGTMHLPFVLTWQSKRPDPFDFMAIKET